MSLVRSLAFTLCVLTLSKAASACELSYAGVVGIGDSTVAMIVNEVTSNTYFLKKDMRINKDGCNLKLDEAKRGRITLSDDHSLLVLTPQGEAKEDTKFEISRSHITTLEQQEETSELYFEKLVTLAEEVVNSGMMTLEEINRAIAAEKQAHLE